MFVYSMTARLPSVKSESCVSLSWSTVVKTVTLTNRNWQSPHEECLRKLRPWRILGVTVLCASCQTLQRCSVVAVFDVPSKKWWQDNANKALLCMQQRSVNVSVWVALVSLSVHSSLPTSKIDRTPQILSFNKFIFPMCHMLLGKCVNVQQCNCLIMHLSLCTVSE